MSIIFSNKFAASVVIFSVVLAGVALFADGKDPSGVSVVEEGMNPVLDKARRELAEAETAFETLNSERVEVARNLRKAIMEIRPRNLEDGADDGKDVQALRKRLAEVERERIRLRDEIVRLLSEKPKYKKRQEVRKQTSIRRDEIEKERGDLVKRIKELREKVTSLENASEAGKDADTAAGTGGGADNAEGTPPANDSK